MKKKIEINIGSSGWIAISFAAGCFGFGWKPFIIVFLLTILESSTNH